MTKEEFGGGLMFYRACCGQDPEPAHIEAWWEMLNYMPVDQFVGAIKLFISTEESPARMNFVATVKKYGGIYAQNVRHEKFLERKRIKELEDKRYKQRVLEENNPTEIKQLIANIGTNLQKEER
jgi:hypothetical protein